MATSNQRSSLAEKQRALLWGAWVELGVSGWQRTHAAWAVDPEPVVIATAALNDEDPRLRDEALDWCIHYWRYVSRVRLRNLLREQPPEVKNAWGPFAATVSHHAGVAWPNATSEFAYKTTGRSALDSMDDGSRAWLRLRGMFGLGARTETLRFFLSGHRRATVARIAVYSRYAKRVVADECDTLAKAGVLRSEHVANRFYYMLNRAEALREFVGPIAPIHPDWSAIFRVTSPLVALEKASTTLSPRALMVEAHRIAQQLDADLNALDIEDRPMLLEPDNYWAALREFAERHLGAWAMGRWLAAEGVVEMKPPRLMRRASASTSR